ncbi:histidine kinase [Actinoplanes sp. NPDC049802]|uniref:sensor histidine kinase n=1 Tax=Actinoplanes sp. NPDC049802 TaxID=3154742 RepID=UPI0033D89068
MTARRWLIDSMVATSAAVFTLVMLQQGGLGSQDGITRPLDPLGVVLALVSTVPLIFTRRAPGTVFAITALASMCLIAINYPLDVPPGALIATYALAEKYGGASRRRRYAACTAVMLYPPVAISLTAVNDQVRSMLSIAPGFAAWITMFLLVWVAGDRNRLRQERIAELEEHARLRELDIAAQRRLAAAQERTRIARELHDSAGHAINVILVQAGAARLLHERDPQRSRQAIETIEEVAQSTIADIDRLVRALREEAGPADPAPADTAALEQLVDRHRASGLRVSTTFDGAPRGLPSGVAWAAYRILQEALTNAARHGSGTADVRMAYGNSEVEIEVSNPVGSVPQRGGGMGIVGMRERVALLDGTLEADTAGPELFRLRARLPIAATEAAM